jgi:hypothetical protein
MIYKQPYKSSLCGQCCLSYILDVDLNQSCILVGHPKATKSKELMAHLGNSRNKRGYPDKDSVSLCVQRSKVIKRSNWHWIVYDRGYIYDPTIGELIPEEVYFEKFPDLKITSYFRIK